MDLAEETNNVNPWDYAVEKMKGYYTKEQIYEMTLDELMEILDQE